MAALFALGSGLLQAAPDPSVYGRFPEVELLRIAPSGKRYAFITVAGDKRRLGVVEAGGKPLFATDIDTAKVLNLHWAGEDHLLVTVSTTYRQPSYSARDNELTSVLDVDLLKQTSAGVFDKASTVGKVVLGSYGSGEVGGQRFAYFGGLAYIRRGDGGLGPDPEHLGRNLYRVNLADGKAALLAYGDQRFYDWALTPQGEVVAHSEHDGRSGDWALFEGKTGKHRFQRQQVSAGEVMLLGLGRTAGHVLVSDRTGERVVLHEVEVASGRSEALFGDRSVEKPLFDPETGLLLGALVAEEPGAALFDARLQARYDATRKAFSGLQMELVSFTPDFDRMIVFTDGGDDSGTYWLVDPPNRKADPIASAYSRIGPAAVGPTSLLRYKSGDGLDIEAVLTLPPGAAPDRALPLVVMPHDLPVGESGGTRDRLGFDAWAQAYAAAGYAVLQPNYRGSSGFGRSFLEAGYGQWGRSMQTDLSDGVRALADAKRIDPARVCIVGTGYGGYAALAGVSLQRKIYRCAVSVDGVADPAAFLQWKSLGLDPSSRYARDLERRFVGKDAELRSVSPVEFAKQVDVPVLLIHGRGNTVVPIAQSRLMEAALRKAGKPVTLIAPDDKDQRLARESTRMATLKASLDFVREHNPP